MKRFVYLLLLISILAAITRLSRAYFVSSPKHATLEGNSMSNPSAAYFQPGHTTIVKSIKVGEQGGVLKVTDTGTPADGTVIDIPKGALSKDVTLSFGYNDGKVENISEGKSSDIILVLSTEPSISFQQPVKVTVQYSSSIKPIVIVGYSSDDKGRLHLIDMGSWDKKHNQVTFMTFQPIMFTWIYSLSY